MNTPDENLFPFRSALSYQNAEETSPFVVMYHGSLIERNGLELAVDALALLSESGIPIELRVYGRSTPYLDRVMNKVRDLGIEKMVKHFGGRRLDQLAAEIQKCDIGVVPNQLNAFTAINTPTRILEYLALGKPVIAPSTRGVLDYFSSDALLYFKPGDARDLAKQIQTAALHRQDLTAIAKRGQEVYAQHTWIEEKQVLLDTVAGLW
jgi:glycosyltransferase involved in cell wall biosynthesis